MLTEQDVLMLWRKLFHEHATSGSLMEKAEGLLDELRPESPLRHRLTTELREIGKRSRKK